MAELQLSEGDPAFTDETMPKEVRELLKKCAKENFQSKPAPVVDMLERSGDDVTPNAGGAKTVVQSFVHPYPSVLTSKSANEGHLKTGNRDPAPDRICCTLPPRIFRGPICPFCANKIR